MPFPTQRPVHPPAAPRERGPDETTTAPPHSSPRYGAPAPTAPSASRAEPRAHHPESWRPPRRRSADLRPPPRSLSRSPAVARDWRASGFPPARCTLAVRATERARPCCRARRTTPPRDAPHARAWPVARDRPPRNHGAIRAPSPVQHARCARPSSRASPHPRQPRHCPTARPRRIRRSARLQARTA